MLLRQFLYFTLMYSRFIQPSALVTSSQYCAGIFTSIARAILPVDQRYLLKLPLGVSVTFSYEQNSAAVSRKFCGSAAIRMISAVSLLTQPFAFVTCTQY